jgi:transcription antitermination factor NusG
MHWYVLRSKSNKENFLCGQLMSRQIEFYFPMTRAKNANSRAQKIKPYFPGYLFIHVDQESIGLSALSWIPGAIGLVKFGGEPAEISDHLLTTIKQRIEKINNDGRTCMDRFRPGDKVLIEAGPFAGYEALLETCFSGTERVRVLLYLLKNQQMRVTLPVEQMRRVKQL